MRESFGGAFMIKMILVFIVVYVSFMAVAVNYAKAFRVKNNVINILEQSKYVPGDDITKIDDYLASVPYNVKDDKSKEECLNSVDNPQWVDRGVCIAPQIGGYYKVTTYISIEFPFFNLNMTLPISGETKVILN